MSQVHFYVKQSMMLKYAKNVWHGRNNVILHYQ